MITAWTSHLKTDEEKVRFQNSVLGSKEVLERLQQLSKQAEDDVERGENSTKVYDVPNWDYRQADFNGFRRALKLVNRIINLDQQDTKTQ
jgi:hypothetical protein